MYYSQLNYFVPFLQPAQLAGSLDPGNSHTYPASYARSFLLHFQTKFAKDSHFCSTPLQDLTKNRYESRHLGNAMDSQQCRHNVLCRESKRKQKIKTITLYLFTKIYTKVLPYNLLVEQRLRLAINQKIKKIIYMIVQ